LALCSAIARGTHLGRSRSLAPAASGSLLRIQQLQHAVVSILDDRSQCLPLQTDHILQLSELLGFQVLQEGQQAIHGD
jgi:hypothetical protein